MLFSPKVFVWTIFFCVKLVKCYMLQLVLATLLRPAQGSPLQRFRRVRCLEPPEDVLHKQWVAMNSRADNPSETDAIVPIHTKDIIGHHANVIQGDRHPQKPEVALMGNIPCNEDTKDFRFRSQLGTNERSLCRWYYVIQNDPLRYPRDITQARSKCGSDDPSQDCQVVVFYSRILYRTDVCVDGYYIYEPKWQEIILGYSSARVI